MIFLLIFNDYFSYFRARTMKKSGRGLKFLIGFIVSSISKLKANLKVLINANISSLTSPIKTSIKIPKKFTFFNY